jgi:aspartate kinase
MIVIKFGGTSVGDAVRVQGVIEILTAARDRQPVVVVSALAGVTNDLVAATVAAAAGDLALVESIIERVSVRHQDVAIQLVQQKSDYFESFLAQLRAQVEQIRDILKGIVLVGEVTPRARDKVVAIGEKLSSVLVAYSMRLRALPAVYVDSEEVIITDDHFGEAAPLIRETRTAARRVLLPELERNHIPVMGGFIGRSRSGATTTLGRGGSDYTAAIVGSVLEAEEIQIWTDVDGMMTCDPRLIPEARVIERISYVEAAELAWFGAKVLHPKTIAPAVELGIPVRVLNTHNRESKGTLITEEGDGEAAGPRAIAVKRDIVVVHVTSSQMLGVPGFLARLFAVFEQLGISVDLITTSEISVSVTVDATERVPELVERLTPFATVRVLDAQCIVAVVGRNLIADSTVAARVFESLRGVPIAMFSLGNSGLNLSIVVAAADADRAVRSAHRALFESPVGARV